MKYLIRKTVSFTANIGLSQRGVKDFLEDGKLVLPTNTLIIDIKQMIIKLLKTNNNTECGINMTTLLL